MMLPMATTVTGELPEIAAKNTQPATADTANPPGIQENVAFITLTSRRANEPWVINSPATTKNGIASRTSFEASSISLRMTTVRSSIEPSPETWANSRVPRAPIRTNSGCPVSNAAAMVPMTRNVTLPVKKNTPASSASHTIAPTFRCR